MTNHETKRGTKEMTGFDSVAAARELRDSVPADQQPRLRGFMDIVVRSFERDRERDAQS